MNKFRILRSNEIFRETSKNSYFNKYIEENNRSKIKYKKRNNNNSLRQSNTNYERKENNISNHLNYSLFIHKKSKNNSNNSVDKKVNNNSNNMNNTIQKKIKRNLSSMIHNENTSKDDKNKDNNILADIPETNKFLLKQKNNKKIFNKEVLIHNNLTINNENKENNDNNDNNEKVNNVIIPKIDNLSQKEKAYLILSYSKCLRFCERMIFSRSTSKLRESISKNQMLETNKIYLKEKKQELEKQIEDCDDKLNIKFNASKTAEMTLNYISSIFENDFRLNLYQSLEDEEDKKYYYNYVKLIYLLLDENYDQVKNENLMKTLYQKILKKGYKNIKDYLYYIYIKNLEENKVLENTNKINEILNETPDLLTFNHSVDSNRFISYSCYLFKEIITYANEKIDTFKLKSDCMHLIDVINNKLKLYK